MRSEQRILRKDSTGNKTLMWIHVTGRNEAWDCEVYAYGAYLYTMQGRHAETVFRQRERLFAAALQGDLLDAASSAPQAGAINASSDDVQASARGDQEEIEIKEQAASDVAVQQQIKQWTQRKPSFKKKSFASSW